MQGSYRVFLFIWAVFISITGRAQQEERWNTYLVSHINTSNLNPGKILGGKKKGSALENNISNFYLYLNGALVKPSGDKVRTDFFPAGCLCFKFNDTLMLNSGLGSERLGVGIKIYGNKFSGSLHANSGNASLFKFNKKDEAYLNDITIVPETQSLKLLHHPSFSSNEIIVGEYRATYKQFYRKNKSRDELKKYTVRLIFKCKITGIDAIREETGMNSQSNTKATP